LSNLNGFDPGVDAVSYSDMLSLDRWAVDRAAQLQKEVIEAYRGYNFHQIYQKLHHFCAVDLGGFYLDVIKDRQYTTQADSLARRSAQTAMYHIAEALVRWIAPILSFTAEEIWENLPGERGPSVMLVQWYQGLQSLSSDDAMGRLFWERLMSVRTAVNKAMEERRAAGALRGSLDAAITLYCSPDLYESLRALGDELRFVLITSAATLIPLDAAGADAVSTDLPDLRLVIAVAGEEKCERCWHRSQSVGQSAVHPTLCGRCIENIDGDGERRQYA
jgi:isoleucyl-tRNA synthetase